MTKGEMVGWYHQLKGSEFERRRGWDVSREQHRNMYIIYGERDHSPDWIHETSAPAWCTGKTQRDRVEREVGAGSRVGWGIHVSPWLIHVNVRQNPLQYCN